MFDRLLPAFPFLRMHKAMVDVVVDQCSLRAGNCVFDSLKLLRNIDAWPFDVDHFHDATKMTASTVEPLHDLWVTGMSGVSHHHVFSRRARRVERG